ncbi:chitinase 11-like [Ananas comosus]|uniref:chitinase n=1 Tax=Ananas comosus TaxID=4615 RepID=A0A6P5FDP5_ANACO|nr:chitinase 11-like [Ananas comosus]
MGTLIVSFLSLTLLLCYATNVGGQSVSSIITQSLFNQMLKHRNDAACPAKGFYTYDAFVQAANSFRGFGTTGDLVTRKRELAAFFGQTSHETTGGWPSAPDGPYAWGYCLKEERAKTDPPYYGRGPIQLTHKYNYDLAGKAIGKDLVNNPNLIATDPVVSFKTAMWFWMTPQGQKPSCHDVITGRWKPSAADSAAGRAPGYGVTTNIINGGLECGKGFSTNEEKDRVGFYQKYCDILGVSYGANVGCLNQKPYGN